MSFKITRLWAFLSVDQDGDEGLVAGRNARTGLWMPFVAADEARIDDLRGHVASLVPMLRENKQKVRLARFDTRTDVEVIG